MRRVWRISEFWKCRKTAPFSIDTHRIIAKPSVRAQLIREHVTEAPDVNRIQMALSDIVSQLADKWCLNTAETNSRKYLRKMVSKLKDEIMGLNDVEKIENILDEKGVPLFRRFSDGSAVVELLMQLKPFPSLALEVFSWRRKQLDPTTPMTSEEYSNGIALAGRARNVDLAVELFKEASNKELKATSLYNALMITYAYNGLPVRCQLLFRELKMDTTCIPSEITYNILISTYGRMMLVDHMEATFREMKDLNLTPTTNTYKNLIAGYITAWRWEEMEKAYLMLRAGPNKPDRDVHLLMIRGYAHSRQLEKMEEIYEMVRDYVDLKEISLIRAMICAYCRSSDVDRVEKVEALLRLIPENEYRPWLNVIVICLYAKENLLEQMENSINEAFKHQTYVRASSIMKCIISNYFRHDAVDKLADFVQRAEHAGWKRCRSVYHCKMVMYSSQMRLSEMERVLAEMDRVNMYLSKKTFWILYKTYKRLGEWSKLEQVVGSMCKHGYGMPLIHFDTS